MHEIVLRPQFVTRFSLGLLAAAMLLSSAPPVAAVSFDPAQTLQSGLLSLTSVALGPEDSDPLSSADGCLYALQQNGQVSRICFDAAKSVISQGIVITVNSGGSVNAATGIAVDPASDPSGTIIFYVSYATGNGAPFNGRIARATSTDGGASYTVDDTFITGLGRSSFDHQTNGLDVGPDGCLYWAQGNNSNAGYDSAFAESRLSSAVLRACVRLAGGDVDPTFDRNCGDGGTQEACGVEVYASGLRNPYDLVWHSNGNLYCTDNDPGSGFRDDCGANANTFGCPCQDVTVEDGDELNLIEQGKYYGSPNPYLANPAELQCQGGTNPGDACTMDLECGTGGTCQDLSALCTDPLCGEGVQCYLAYSTQDDATANDPGSLLRNPLPDTTTGQPIWSGRMDGIDEYSGSFCSDWDGDLLVTPVGGAIRRMDLAPDGLSMEVIGSIGLSGLDVTVGPDGTIYAADRGAGSVTYLTPIDDASFDACGVGESCVGSVCQPASCSTPGECDDGNQCTIDDCIASACDNTVVADGTSCDDGDAGTINDQCTGGVCAGQTADGDNDGLSGGNDPCPSDPLNRCFGPVAVDTVTTSEIRVNASATSGCGAQVDCNGDTWVADFGFNTGNVNKSTATIVGLDSVFGCTPGADGTEDILQCERWDPAAVPELEYSFDVPDGTYLVNLLFANTFSGTAAPGSRVFDIVIEGQTAYAGFDQIIAAQANPTGNPNGDLTAVVRSAIATVSGGGGLQIGFIHVTENPTVKAIEVLELGGCLGNSDCQAPVPPCEGGEECQGSVCVSLPDGAIGTPCNDGDLCTSSDECDGLGDCAGTPVACGFGEICNPATGACESVLGCANPPAGDLDCDGLADAGDPCPNDALNRCAGPVAECAATGGNCAAAGDDVRFDANPTSPAVTSACNLELWYGETGAELGSASPGSIGPNDPAFGLDSVTGVFGCEDDPTGTMLLNERYGSPLSRSYPVANGTYLVNLLFMESFSGACSSGFRVFDGFIEGQEVLSDFAQYDVSEALNGAGNGCYNLVVRSFLAYVADGQLDLSLVKDATSMDNNASIKALDALLVECVDAADCDDGDPCTLDTCNGDGTCTNSAVADGTSCDDGLYCNGVDTCSSGVCLGDGNPCSVNGECADVCDEAGDTCLDDPVGTTCTDDGNQCTANTCDGNGTCAGDLLPDGTTCDDADPLTVNDQCTAGVCAGTADIDNDAIPNGSDPDPNDPRNLVFGPVAVDGTTGNDIRINTFGLTAQPLKTDCTGAQWIPDYGFNVPSGGVGGCDIGGGCPISGIDTIFGCTDAETEDVFQFEHWDPAALPELLYSFVVPDGEYVVNLYFANTFTGTAAEGSRVFDINIEGALAHDDFDQVAAAGGSATAVVRSAVVTVGDGDGLQIEFIHDVQNTNIKGIEVLCPAASATTWYADADGDGFGDALVSRLACTQPGGYVSDATDCDDASAGTFPGAAPNDSMTECLKDADGDDWGDSAPPAGVTVGTDCDDTNPAINPGAAEIPDDAIDQDCSGADAVTCYPDTDDDTYGDSAATGTVDPDGECDLGTVADNTDCNDADAGINPGAAEIPDDGIDQDCSGTDAVTCYTDADDDTYGDSAATGTVDPDGECDLGTVADNTDCNDADAGINPGAAEIPDDGIDQDCSGSDAVTCYPDTDNDTYGDSASTGTVDPDGTCDAGSVLDNTDCDDTNPGINPGAAEIPDDGIDQDCSGTDAVTCYPDTDDDTYGDSAATGTVDPDGECDLGTVADNTDCNDADAGINPDATEIPDNGIDEDCDGFDAVTCYPDTDGDTYGDSSAAGAVDPDGTCDTGLVSNNADCNDGDAAINPDATEIPDNGIDEDCDGFDAVTCYPDTDGDTYGDSSAAGAVDPDGTCDTGLVSNNADCNDGDAAINPDATEIPDNGIDEDCDGFDAVTCYPDTDGDTYGDSSAAGAVDPDGTCDTGLVSNNADCNDGDAAINPDATEIPDNGIDEDCDGFDAVTCYPDTDGDTYGDSSAAGAVDPDGTCDTGLVSNNADCNDGDAAINPDATEIPDNGIDEDCDGFDAVTCYPDTDGDTYGDSSAAGAVDPDGTCDTGLVSNNADCNDGDAAINPDATEIPDNGIDEDCDGFDAVTCYPDTDGDTYGDSSAAGAVDPDGTCDTGLVSNNADCNDGDAAINPDATEIPDNGIDEDCDGFDAVTCYPDTDGDTYGDSSAAGAVDPDGTCDTGLVSNNADCNDGDAAINPDATEIPDNGIDEDCDGFDAVTCYPDTDGDTYGDSSAAGAVDPDGTCDTGLVSNNADCNDGDAAINPDATEIPDNGIDEDCDGFDAATCYPDADGDTYGDSASTGAVDPDGECDTGLVSNNADCNDGDAAINPDATEIPDNGIDENCDGFDAVICYLDADSDTYGDSAATGAADPDGECDTGLVSNNADCNDGDAAINPDATEIPDNGIDEDCDGFDAVTCYPDADGDTYGDGAAAGAVDPDGTCDTGLVSNNADCNDGDAAINPGAAEIPDDGIDQDCSGADAVTCYPDTDGDTYGDSSAAGAVDSDGTCDTGLVSNNADCNDGDAAINPDATEIPDNGIDEDCDGFDAVTCYPDTDGDTYGDSSAAGAVDPDGTCDTGLVSNNADCNDGDAAINPDATEIPDNGIDEDCDGFDAVTCYPDADGDTYGDSAATGAVDPDGECDTGLVSNNADCNDGDAAINPDATEIPDNGIDEDCDGFDAVTCYADADGDTYGDSAATGAVDPDGECDTGLVSNNADCNDGDAAINPDATEIPDNGIDEDCDGFDAVTCYPDADGDTYGDSAATGAADPDGECDTGLVSNNADCNDGDAAINPDATEIPDNGIDEDCDGFDAATCYPDADGDTYGDSASTGAVDPDGECDTGLVSNNADCNDGDAAINPDATEIPDNGIDEDCDGFDAVICYPDADGDTYGDSASTGAVDPDGECDTGLVSNNADCNDGDAAINPDATEIPDNEIDEDCDGFDAVTCYPDTDGDTYGDSAAAGAVDPDGTCDTGLVSNNADCNDGDAAINPDATEIPDNGIDEDCDGFDAVTCYADADGDTYGDSAATGAADPDGECDTGLVSNNADCNDGDAAINPDATEIPDNGIDEDCDGFDAVTCYPDTDGDTYGDSAATGAVDPDGECDTGLVSNNADCNDGDAAINPDATEIPDNGIDEDCDGFDAVTCYADADGDTYGDSAATGAADPDGECDTGLVSNNADCNDGDAAINPDATEIPDNGIDEDCDGTDAVTCYTDADGDTYGDPASPVIEPSGACSAGTVADDTDCNDGDAEINPGATEFPDDGIDQDCNGFDSVTCYTDADGDGFGDAASPVIDPSGACSTGTVSDATDCDDTSAATFPGAAPSDSATACMNDDDADGWGDSAPPAGVTPGTDCNDADAAINPETTWYEDTDGDGYGTDVSLVSCEQPAGYALLTGDCLENGGFAAATFPGAAPNDDPLACMTDVDGDDWGRSNPPPSVTAGTDCADGDATSNPAALEVCDGNDNDCDGAIPAEELDDDADGYAECGPWTDPQGDQPAIVGGGDCDDADPASNPGATEACDGNDNDCDTLVPASELDGDGDGYVACEPWSDTQGDQPAVLGGNDCDDSDSAVNPAATEICDGVDNNCDTGIDETGDALCDNGLFCDGLETCGGTAGCLVGEPVECGDGSTCTTDVCVEDPGGAICSYAPSGECGVGGTVLYYSDSTAEPSAKPVSGVDVLVGGDTSASATTDGTGGFAVADVAGSVSVSTGPKLGLPRADDGSAITSFDSALIAQSAVGLLALSPNQQIAGDVTGDGTVGSFDAAFVAQYAALLIDHLPIATLDPDPDSHSDWAFLRCDSYVGPLDQSCASPLYEYDPLLASELADFYGVLYGDVSGNWTPGAARAQKAGQSAEPRSPMAEEIARKAMPAGAPIRRDPGMPEASLRQVLRPGSEPGRWEVLLVAERADGILGLDLVLEYDPSRIRVLDVAGGDAASTMSLVPNDDGEQLRIALFGTRGLEGEGAIVRIEIEAATLSRGSGPFAVRATANEGQVPIRIKGLDDSLGRPGSGGKRPGLRR